MVRGNSLECNRKTQVYRRLLRTDSLLCLEITWRLRILRTDSLLYPEKTWRLRILSGDSERRKNLRDSKQLMMVLPERPTRIRQPATYKILELQTYKTFLQTYKNFLQIFLQDARTAVLQDLPARPSCRLADLQICRSSYKMPELLTYKNFLQDARTADLQDLLADLQELPADLPTRCQNCCLTRPSCRPTRPSCRPTRTSCRSSYKMPELQTYKNFLQDARTVDLQDLLAD
ncbi:hypothetical protein GE061_018922 [Apolygus lucorum]|uniref:Uncharacterized protein n=1 Tax=Apolygus lucorum TaxID=248454 RepID=A0A6A4JK95_APOLU|nr:hypothetical protein GE061_018922 [Apolygus lucorum]